VRTRCSLRSEAFKGRNRNAERHQSEKDRQQRKFGDDYAGEGGIYFTNSLYGAIDPQFYPEGINGWMVKVNAKPEGGIEFDRDFFIDWPASHRPHQVRLQGGDASSDSYCYP